MNIDLIYVGEEKILVNSFNKFLFDVEGSSNIFSLNSLFRGKL